VTDPTTNETIGRELADWEREVLESGQLDQVKEEIAATYPQRRPRPLRRRAVLRLNVEQIATLLKLPPDVTVGGFALEPITDTVAFGLESERFDPVAEFAEPPRLIAEVTVIDEPDGSRYHRVTWDGLDGAEVVTHHGPADEYQRRGGTVRARQYLGDNEAHIQELAGADFHQVDEEDRDDDPDATGALLTAPNSTWVPMYDGDWVVQHGDGWKRMTDEEFVADFRPVTT
jgi:hypothetical protein